MSRLHLHLVIPAILTGCAIQPASTIPIERWSTVQSQTRPLRPESLKKIAIVPIQDGVNSQNSGAILSSSIYRIMEKWKFSTVDRQDLNILLKERSLIQSGLFANTELQELGKKLNADFVMTGIVTKYKSYTLETQGAEYKRIIKNSSGKNIEVTEHSENSLRELYSTGARLKLIDIQTGENVYEFDVSTENWQIDNIQSFEQALNQHLYYENIRAKRDSANKGTVRYEAEKYVTSKGLHSLIDELDLVKESNEILKRVIACKITNESRFIIQKNGRYNYIDINTKRTDYEYVDGEIIGDAINYAIENHFANNDSASIINGLKYFSATDSISRAKICATMKQHSSLFSENDAMVLRQKYGIKFGERIQGSRSGFKSSTQSIPLPPENKPVQVQPPVDTHRRSR